jgi:flagellar biosynthesis protein FliR
MKKKSLGTVIGLALVFAAFVAAIAEGVYCAAASQNLFWSVFGLILWGAVAGLVWMVGCLIWSDEI